MSFATWLDQIMTRRARLAVLGGALLLVLAPLFPLWKITMFANQFPEGLRLSIYTHKVVGGQGGVDLQGINILNHYIGMREIHESDFVEMKFLPFALGVFLLISLRASVFARVGNLVDLTVLFGYFATFSFGAFWYRMYSYGHELAADAPIKVAPFTPPVFGHQHIANFDVYSYPALGTYLLLGFGLSLAGLVLYQARAARQVRV